MTPEQIEGTKVILRYEGWEVSKPSFGNNFFENGTQRQPAYAFIYYRSLDEIAPVVNKVVAELQANINNLLWFGREERWKAVHLRRDIQLACSEMDIRKLFPAVVSAINFINDKQKDSDEKRI